MGGSGGEDKGTTPILEAAPSSFNHASCEHLETDHAVLKPTARLRVLSTA
jgi:hypothetical protein